MHFAACYSTCRWSASQPASGAAGQEAAAPADHAEVQQQLEARKVARLIHAWMERTCGQLTPTGLARLRQVTHA